MQEAVPVGVGAMAAILGLDFAAVSAVAEAAAQGEVCQAANDNDPGQVVVSGHKAAVERALDLAKEAGAKRAVLLPVSAPFHCALMQPAAERMAQALAEVDINTPSVAYLAAEGVTEIWEVGAGKALSGMIRRIDRAIACQTIGSPEDIAKLKGAADA